MEYPEETGANPGRTYKIHRQGIEPKTWRFENPWRRHPKSERTLQKFYGKYITIPVLFLLC